MMARASLDVTASEFSCAAFDESDFVSRAQLLEDKVRLGARKHVDNDATRFGLKYERSAIAQYARDTGHAVNATGLWTDTSVAVGASPDGLIVDPATGELKGLLEVKCFYSRRAERAFPQWDQCPRRYYAQIQGQLAVCDAAWCDLVCWIHKNSRAQNYCVIRIVRDQVYCEQLAERLAHFSTDLGQLRREFLASAARDASAGVVVA